MTYRKQMGARAHTLHVSEYPLGVLSAKIEQGVRQSLIITNEGLVDYLEIECAASAQRPREMSCSAWVLTSGICASPTSGD